MTCKWRAGNRAGVGRRREARRSGRRAFHRTGARPYRSHTSRAAARDGSLPRRPAESPGRRFANSHRLESAGLRSPSSIAANAISATTRPLSTRRSGSEPAVRWLPPAIALAAVWRRARSDGASPNSSVAITTIPNGEHHCAQIHVQMHPRRRRIDADGQHREPEASNERADDATNRRERQRLGRAFVASTASRWRRVRPESPSRVVARPNARALRRRRSRTRSRARAPRRRRAPRRWFDSRRRSGRASGMTRGDTMRSVSAARQTASCA